MPAREKAKDKSSGKADDHASKPNTKREKHKCGGHVHTHMPKTPTSVARATGPVTPKDLAADIPEQAVHGAYYGTLRLRCPVKDGKVQLVSTVAGMQGQKSIVVKTIDAQKNKINGLADDRPPHYRVLQLAKLPATEVDIDTCEENWKKIGILKAKEEAKGLSDDEQEELRALRVYNNAVDIHFFTCLYLKYLQDRLQINSIVDVPGSTTDLLISLHNVPDYDNAYFYEDYMVYGNGNEMFNPLGTIDIGGHELGHGIVQKVSRDHDLEYVGESGAMNESFADILGVEFERYCYATIKDLPGVADWLMGEDAAVRALRNMADPNTTDQPKYYKQPGFWASTSPSAADSGGVHTNSGVSNFCFYSACHNTANGKLQEDVKLREQVLPAFIEALKHLGSEAQYKDYATALTSAATGDLKKSMKGALNATKLSALVAKPRTAAAAESSSDDDEEADSKNDAPKTVAKSPNKDKKKEEEEEEEKPKRETPKKKKPAKEEEEEEEKPKDTPRKKKAKDEEEKPKTPSKKKGKEKEESEAEEEKSKKGSTRKMPKRGAKDDKAKNTPKKRAKKEDTEDGEEKPKKSKSSKKKSAKKGSKKGSKKMPPGRKSKKWAARDRKRLRMSDL